MKALPLITLIFAIFAAFFTLSEAASLQQEANNKGVRSQVFLFSKKTDFFCADTLLTLLYLLCIMNGSYVTLIGVLHQWVNFVG